MSVGAQPDLGPDHQSHEQRPIRAVNRRCRRLGIRADRQLFALSKVVVYSTSRVPRSQMEELVLPSFLPIYMLDLDCYSTAQYASSNTGDDARTHGSLDTHLHTRPGGRLET